MSLKIYLDDCAHARQLVALLKSAGHEVVTPTQAGTSAKDDPVHFRFAVENGLVLLTKNPDDFAALHAGDSGHAGILLIYQDNDADRDMSNAEIVRAITNMESAGIELKGNCHVLNAWRY